MRTRSVATALLIALAPVVASPSAFAQTSEDPVVKAARARFNEGVEFYDKGQYENARASFLQAYALRKHPAVLLNLAQSSLHSGHTLEAARSFQQFLRDSNGLTATQRSDAEKGLTEARTKLGRLEISAPAGTEIEVDGDHVGAAPLSETVDVEPGSHTVKSSVDSKTLTLAAGQVAPVRLSPAAATADTPVPPPVVPVPIEEPTPLPVAPSATPKAAEPSPEKTRGFFSPPKTMAPFWVGLAVGVAGGATAVVFAVFKGEASSNSQTLQSEIVHNANERGISPNNICVTPPTAFQSACSSFQNDINLLNTDATVANVAVGVGIAGVAFSLGWYLFAAKQDATPEAPNASGPFVPFVGPHEGGLGYSGSF